MCIRICIDEGFQESGTLFGSPYKKEHSALGSSVRPQFFGNPNISYIYSGPSNGVAISWPWGLCMYLSNHGLFGFERFRDAG